MFSEEGGEQLSGLFGTDAVGHLDPMVQTGIVTHVVEAVTGTRFEISGSVDHPIDAAVHQRSPAHQARLESDHERALIEAPGPDNICRVSQRQDLGMRRRVAGEFAFVVPTGNDVAVLDHDRSNRHIAVGEREAGFVER